MKAYKFEINSRVDEETNELKNTTLVAYQPSIFSRSNSNPSNFLINEKFAMFVPKFKKFMRKNNIPSNQESSFSSTRRTSERSSGSRSNEAKEYQNLCYNCQTECPYPLVSKHQSEPKSSTKEKSRSTPGKISGMPSKSDSRSHLRSDKMMKALVIEEPGKVVKPLESSSSSDWSVKAQKTRMDSLPFRKGTR